MVGSGLLVAVVELDVDLEGLLVVGFGLLPLALLLGDHAEVVVGSGLAVAVVELDVDLEGLLEMAFGLLPLPLALGDRAEVVIRHRPPPCALALVVGAQLLDQVETALVGLCAGVELLCQ